MQPFDCRMCKTKYHRHFIDTHFWDQAKGMSFALSPTTQTNKFILVGRDNGALRLSNL